MPYWEPTELQNRVNDLNVISFTVSSIETIITAITGTTTDEVFTRTELNKVLDTVKFLNEQPKHNRDLYEKEFNSIIRNLVNKLEIVKSESIILEGLNDPNKVNNRTTLLNIDPNSLKDGETRYVEDEDTFYAFNRDVTTGFVPVTTETSSPGTWDVVTSDDVNPLFNSISGTTVSGETIYSGFSNVDTLFIRYDVTGMTTGTAFTFNNTFNTLSINLDSSSATTIFLNDSPSINEFYIVKDRNGIAPNFNITVSGSGKNIDGDASIVISSAGKPSYTFLYDGDEYIII